MSVVRTVQFWQLVDPKSGEAIRGVFPAGEFVRQLKKTGVNKSRWKTRDNWQLTAEGIRERQPQHIALHRIRREGLPSIEQGGVFSDLELAEDENLAETTHFRFFARNVVGLLYNHDGPHVRRFKQYSRGMWKIDVDLVPILRRDVARALDRMTEISVVDVAIPVDRAYLLEDDGSDTIRALKEMTEKSASKTVNARFSLRGTKVPSGPAKWLGAIKGIVRSERLNAFKRLRVRGFDQDAGERMWLDLVAHHLTLSEGVELSSDSGRAVHTQSAADAIKDAYDVLEADINRAVAVVRQSNPPLRLRDLDPTTPKTD